MIFLDLMKYSFGSLGKRKLRSFLTVLSVFIGIAAITALISFGYGISSYVEQVSQQMGNDKLIIQAKAFSFGGPSLNNNVRLTDDDVKAVRQVQGVQEATGVYILSGQIEFNNQKKYAYILGSDYAHYGSLLKEVYSLDLFAGDDLQGKEQSKVVVGYNYQVPDSIFKKPVRLHDSLLVNGQNVKVTGFYTARGNPQDDSQIYMNSQAVEDLFQPKSYQFLLVRSSPGVSPTKLAELVTKKLRDHRHQKAGNEDFFVQTFEQVIATFTSVLNVITAVVVLIAFISVFVAAVNIMNTMYTAILERTKEIGVFKAVGSKNSYILFVFTLEAGILGLVGGACGVLVGYLISAGAGQGLAASGYGFFQPLFTWQLVVGSLLFAFFIGALSGLLPAYQASKLKPVDALRYE